MAHALIVKVKYEMHPLQHRCNLSIAFHQIHNFEYVCCMNTHTFSNWNVWVQCDVEWTTTSQDDTRSVSSMSDSDAADARTQCVA